MVPNKSGAPSLQWKGRYLHSKYDPRREAQHQLTELSIKNNKQLIVFMGAGLGYVIEEFCSQYSNPALWFEPHQEIAKLAKRSSQLGKFSQDLNRKSIHHLPKEKELRQLFQGYGNEDIIFYIHRASYGSDEQYHSWQKQIEAFLNRKSVNQATLARFDRLWMRNLSANFVSLLEAQPVKRLFNRANKRQALVCSAGPSLLEDIPKIQAIRKKVVLLAVDTALKPLWKHGIDPDIVLTVDPQAISRHYLTGYTGKAVFVVDPTSSYLSLRALQGKAIFYFWSPFALSKVLFDFLGEDPGQIKFGGSVSTNAYDLALLLGCHSIYFSGLDLAFTEGLAHTRGAAIEELSLYSQDRLQGRELQNYRQLRALPQRHIEGMDGRPLVTNDKLLIFHQWFSRRFQEDKQDKKWLRLCSLSSKGAKIPGLSERKWQDLNRKEQEFSLDLSDLDLAKAKAGKPIDTQLAKDFAHQLRQLSQDFIRYTSKVKEGIKMSKKMQVEFRNNAYSQNFSRLKQQLAHLDKQIIKEQKLSDLTGNILQSLIFQITENAPKGIEKQETTSSDSLHDTSLLYEGLLEAAEIYQERLSKAAQVLDRLSDTYE